MSIPFFINPKMYFPGESDKGPSGREREEEDLPGYPHYPASEDITQPGNSKKNTLRDELDQDENSAQENLDLTGDPLEDDELEIVSGTEADVTAEDLQMLGSKDSDMDMGDDEIYRGRVGASDDLNANLDVPGSELDDENEAMGEEDEENNYYSLGGDRHEGLEEDNQQ